MSNKLAEMHKQLILDIIEINGVPCTGREELFDTDEYIPQQERAFNAISAKNLCESCPVQIRCGEYAILAKEPYGIWGGLTPMQRALKMSRKK